MSDTSLPSGRTVWSRVGPASAPAIALERVVKTFPRRRFLGGWGAPRGARVLRGIDLRVSKGEIVAVMGQNGAGKTTLLEILSTVLLPDGGCASVMGFDVVRDAKHVRRLVSLCTSSGGFFPRLTGSANLEFFGHLHAVQPREVAGRARQALELAGLHASADPVQTYSDGMRQRLNLARALVSDAPVLLLDEPTRGLDPDGAGRVQDLIKTVFARREGRAILLVTHSLEEASRIADRIVMLQDGRLIESAAPTESIRWMSTAC